MRPQMRLSSLTAYLILFLILIVLFTFFDHSIALGASYNVGDTVCVQSEDNWGWYEGSILEISGDKARVHYPDYGDQYDDQWTPLMYFNPPYSFDVGDEVIVQDSRDFSIYWPAEIVDTRDDEYKVHYDGYDSSWDEWVDRCRIFPEPKIGDAVYARYSTGYVFGYLISRDGERWTVRYKGWDSSQDLILEWEDEVGSGDIMPCPPGEQEYEEAFLASKVPVSYPATTSIYHYEPVEAPDPNHNPPETKPIGIGNIAHGGDTLDLVVQVPRFEDWIDIYLAIQVAGSIYILGADEQFYPLDRGLKRWRTHLMYQPLYTLFHDIPVSSLPQGDIYFYLLVSPKDDLTRYYLWYTNVSTIRQGYFTGSALMSQDDLAALASSIINDMVQKGSVTWYEQVENFILENRDSFEVDPYNILAWIFFNQNNIYPFCWAVFKELQQDASNPLSLNSAAVCLFELDDIETGGRLLDLAYTEAPGLPITYENGAYYYDQKGMAQKALEMKQKAAQGDGANPYSAWDGYHYALGHGLTDYTDTFDSMIPSNFSLLKSDGSMGAGPAKTAVCCSCNGGFYYDVQECVASCEVSLACFTSICTPNLQCCWQKTPFSLSPKICFPPQGLQACLAVDEKGNVSLEIGGGFAGIGVYVGLQRDFKGNYTAYLAPGTSIGIGTKITLVSTDPKARKGAMEYGVAQGASYSGLGLSIGLSSSDLWHKSPICDLNYIGQ
ncbi:MAG TPA: hypothetical protein ENJ63_04970 [Dissulfuribacter thermophilus]|uniref:Tudor-knot domain-containing protein n=1 Tax=Dissulfuribacter thermophilus TaxID=1156395 RepID=A0A7V2WT34_9BACT|nr:hypothetical protein [Dissulfuribacter thermophilus]